MSRKTLIIIATVSALQIVLCFALESGRAEAQSGGGNFIQVIRPELHVDLFFHGHELGVGGRLDIPIVQDGLINNVSDELAISPGVDVLLVDSFGVCPLVALQWNFYLTMEWSVFPEVGLAVLFHERGNDDLKADVDPVIVAGGRYHFNSRNALVLRIGWPGVIQFGITF